MARKNQKLINYHTGKKTEMPKLNEVDYGEIVVRHNAESPELLIKISDDSFGVFQASGAVQSAITSAVSAAKLDLNTNISNLETKISDLSGVTKDFSAATVATYATKTELSDAQTAITTAYTDAISDAKKEVYDSATTFATNAVNVAKTELNGSISSLETSLTGHVATFDKFKENVEKTYATKEELKSTSGSIITAIGAAKDDVYSSATSFTTKEVNALSTSISTVASDLEALSGVVESITTNINDNYVTTDSLETKLNKVAEDIATAKKEATDASSAYTDTQIANVFTSGKSYTDAEIQKVNTTIATVKSSVETLSGNVHTRIESLETELTNTINNKVAVAYRYQGTVTNYADLPKNLTSGETGYVYNVENANGHIPAGTNYAWNGTEWDALGGIVDLSPYATTTYVDGKIQEINQTNTDLKSDIDNLSAATESFSAATVATYATKDELKSTSGSIISDYTTAIGDAKDKVYSSATTAAAADAKSKADAAEAAAIAAAAASANTLQNNINNVNNSVTGLSASTVNIETTANSAIQNASIVDSATCKVSVSKDNTVLKFDFSNLVIDCGDF